MVLKEADFGKCEKSSQTPWNVSYVLANGFLTVLGLIRKDFVGISKGLKSTDFDEKNWAIAHGFEEGGFQLVREIVPNSLKRLQHECKWLPNGFS